MINLSSSIYIYRPTRMIFDFITAPANDFEWRYGTLTSLSTSTGTTRPGATFLTIGHLMGRRFQGTFEVTEYESDRRYGFRSISGPLHLDTVFTLEVAARRTRVTITTRATASAFDETKESVIERYMRKQLREDLEMLKQILETRGGMQVPAA